MKKQLLIALALGLDKTFIIISSDIIESLYGIEKQHGTSEIKDANSQALRILAHCGELTKIDAQNVLNISAFDTSGNCWFSVSMQRREILPNPGSLDKINADDKKQNLVTMNRAKKRSKTLVKPDISIDCNNRPLP